jgi:hypothetical protein
MEWIKCSDRMPHKDGWYLTIEKDGHRDYHHFVLNFRQYVNRNSGYKTYENVFVIDDTCCRDDLIIEDVIYWSEFPDVPKDSNG